MQLYRNHALDLSVNKPKASVRWEKNKDGGAYFIKFTVYMPYYLLYSI